MKNIDFPKDQLEVENLGTSESREQSQVSDEINTELSTSTLAENFETMYDLKIINKLTNEDVELPQDLTKSTFIKKALNYDLETVNLKLQRL